MITKTFFVNKKERTKKKGQLPNTILFFFIKKWGNKKQKIIF